MAATISLRRTALTAAWCAALALTGCGDDDTAGAPDGGDVTTTADGGATTEDGSTTTSAPSSTTSTPTTTTSAPTTSASEGPTTTAPAFPAAREDLEHGGPTWAVVLAAAEGTTDHPDLAAAEAAAAEAGYQTGPTNCDEGAPAALGHDDGQWYTVSVYFATREDAEQAAAAFGAHGHDGVAVAEVRTFCLD